MSGSNLPPGVSEYMIPGNRPEDMAEEAFWDALYQKLDADDINWMDNADETMTGRIQKMVVTARDMGYERGFNEGEQEASMAQAMEESEIEEHMHNWLHDWPTASAKSYLREAAKYRAALKHRKDGSKAV
jgi:hypothetical protein